MIPCVLTLVVAVASVLLVSCSPYPEPRPNQPKAGAKPTPAQVEQTKQAKLQGQEDAQKRAEEEKKMQTQTDLQPPETPRDALDSPADSGKKPDSPKPVEYEFAKMAPGRDGFVLSPYNNKIIDARDEKTGKKYPRGTLVSDPTYPASEKKYFRVP